MKPKLSKAQRRPLLKKLRRTLERLESMDHGAGMYPGDWWENAPAQHERLERMGLAYAYYPHNPVHKTRAAITPAGRAALEEQET